MKLSLLSTVILMVVAGLAYWQCWKEEAQMRSGWRWLVWMFSVIPFVWVIDWGIFPNADGSLTVASKGMLAVLVISGAVLLWLPLTKMVEYAQDALAVWRTVIGDDRE